jgi:hypothetical protein
MNFKIGFALSDSAISTLLLATRQPLDNISCFLSNIYHNIICVQSIRRAKEFMWSTRIPRVCASGIRKARAIFMLSVEPLLSHLLLSHLY